MKYEMVAMDKLVCLKRNPQWLTPKQMDSLRKSIEKDGFLAPIVIRPIENGMFEVVSGNHRFLAAKENGMKQIPAVIEKLSDGDAKRIAINLNTIHGEPSAELMAPFLADMDDDVLAEIHLEEGLKQEIIAFDEVLAERLAALEVPEQMNADSVTSPVGTCVCPKCNKTHIASAS